MIGTHKQNLFLHAKGEPVEHLVTVAILSIFASSVRREFYVFQTCPAYLLTTLVTIQRSILSIIQFLYSIRRTLYIRYSETKQPF